MDLGGWPKVWGFIRGSRKGGCGCLVTPSFYFWRLYVKCVSMCEVPMGNFFVRRSSTHVSSAEWLKSFWGVMIADDSCWWGAGLSVGFGRVENHACWAIAALMENGTQTRHIWTLVCTLRWTHNPSHVHTLEIHMKTVRKQSITPTILARDAWERDLTQMGKILF